MTINRFSPSTPPKRGQIVAAVVVGVIAVAVTLGAAWLMFGDSVNLALVPSSAAQRQAARSPGPEAVLDLPAEALSPLNLRDLSAQDAMALNETMPIAKLPNPPARPFNFVGTEADFNSAVDCLAATIYYEARNEPAEGQRAVAQVVLNRLRHPQYPKTVCDVVFQGSQRTTGCQFSFTCDGNMVGPVSIESFRRFRTIAEQALRGAVYGPVGGATHYHASYVVPFWADSLVKVRVIGLHIFYRWPGGAGLPAAFIGRHQGVEAVPPALNAIFSGTALERVAEVPLVEEPAILTTDLDISTAAPAPASATPAPVITAALPPPPAQAAAPVVAPPPPPAAERSTAPPSNRRVPFSRSNW